MNFSRNAEQILHAASRFAATFGSNSVDAPHLLLAVHNYRGDEATFALRQLVDDAHLRNSCTALLRNSQFNRRLPEPFNESRMQFSTHTNLVLAQAQYLAEKFASSAAEPIHLVLAGLLDNTMVQALIDAGASEKQLEELRQKLSSMAAGSGEKRVDPYGQSAGAATIGLKEQSGNSNSGFKPGSVLAQFGRDLTELAAGGKLDPVVGRQKEIERCIQVLGRRRKSNPLLIGDPGVGKTAIAEGIALRINKGNVPPALQDKRIVQVEMSYLVAGTKYRGEFEQRLSNLISDVISAGNIILFIDELHTVIGAGAAEGALDASNVLKPALARGEIRLLGATTLEEYKKQFRKDGAFGRRFLPVTVGAASLSDTVEILQALVPGLARHHGVNYSAAAIQAAVALSHRYITDRVLPDKAIDVLDEAGSSVAMRRVHSAAADVSAEVSAQDVAEIVNKWTGVPVGELEETEATRLVNLEDNLRRKVVGQDKALAAVSNAVRTARAGLNNPDQPIGFFLFLGRTGVGKTAVALALQQLLFGSGKPLRFDMSEYMEKHAVARLIGAPPGYVGYEEGGKLTEAVRRQPFSVILLDEIEKAHPDVLNILLQIGDYGKLTDGLGQEADFRNTIIIMTSNIGSAEMKKNSLGFQLEDSDLEDIPDRVMKAVRGALSPEFINRIDEMVLFHALERKHLESIIDIMLTDLRSRLSARGITLKLTDAAKDLLIRKGTDEQYGARPLKKTINKLVAQPLSNLLLSGNLSDGMIVETDAADGRLIFNSRKPQESPAQPDHPPACNACI